ncbi:hypothetical protein Q3G72_029104 [Acer saccharum]|nr:hypothetical protein Q3G72_029104 [Acer saccharum]
MHSYTEGGLLHTHKWKELQFSSPSPEEPIPALFDKPRIPGLVAFGTPGIEHFGKASIVQFPRSIAFPFEEGDEDGDLCQNPRVALRFDGIVEIFRWGTQKTNLMLGRFRLLPFHCIAALAGTTSPLSHASNQLAWFTGSTENSYLLKRSIVRFRR